VSFIVSILSPANRLKQNTKLIVVVLMNPFKPGKL
jgi:hypothetical protein